MEIHYFKNIEIDVCMKTGGIWLDKDEILPVAMKMASEEGRKVESREQGSSMDAWDWIDGVLHLLSLIPW